MTGLFPEWLCLRNLSHTATAAGRSGVKAGIFQAHEHTGGECPSRAVLGLRLQCGVCCKICSQVFMHGDVVEAAKAVLHFIERREKRFRNCDAFCRGTPSRRIRPHSALFLLGCAAYAVRADRVSPRVDLVYIFSSNGALIPQPQRLRSAYLRAHATDRLAGDATRQFRAMPRLSAANDETVLTEPHCGPSALTTSAAPLDRETGAAFRSSWRNDALQVLPHVSER